MFNKELKASFILRMDIQSPGLESLFKTVVQTVKEKQDLFPYPIHWSFPSRVFQSSFSDSWLALFKERAVSCKDTYLSSGYTGIAHSQLTAEETVFELQNAWPKEINLQKLRLLFPNQTDWLRPQLRSIYQKQEGAMLFALPQSKTAFPGIDSNALSFLVNNKIYHFYSIYLQENINLLAAIKRHQRWHHQQKNQNSSVNRPLFFLLELQTDDSALFLKHADEFLKIYKLNFESGLLPFSWDKEQIASWSNPDFDLTLSPEPERLQNFSISAADAYSRPNQYLSCSQQQLILGKKRHDVPSQPEKILSAANPMSLLNNKNLVLFPKERILSASMSGETQLKDEFLSVAFFYGRLCQIQSRQQSYGVHPIQSWVKTGQQVFYYKTISSFSFDSSITQGLREYLSLSLSEMSSTLFIDYFFTEDSPYLNLTFCVSLPAANLNTSEVSWSLMELDLFAFNKEDEVSIACLYPDQTKAICPISAAEQTAIVYGQTFLISKNNIRLFFHAADPQGCLITSLMFQTVKKGAKTILKIHLCSGQNQVFSSAKSFQLRWNWITGFWPENNILKLSPNVFSELMPCAVVPYY